jgi:ABC-type lipoprotein release transport system permease subunit
LGVLSLLLRAMFRHRWRSWLLLCLLIALVAGLAMAAGVAGRRTASAFPRFEADHGYDVFFYSGGPLPKVATLPAVASSALVVLPAGGRPDCACTRPISESDFSIFEVAPKNLSHMVKLISGRMPHQSDPHEVLASVSLQQDNGVHIGSVFHVPLASLSQRSEELNGSTFTPDGPNVTLRVVGIEVSQIEFPATNSPSDDLYTTQAFDRAYDAKTLTLDAYFLRLRHGSASLPEFQVQARRLGALSLSDLHAQDTAIELSIHPQAVGWWILAGLAGLVGLIVIAQALARQAAVEAGAFATLRALGISRRQLILLGLGRTALVGLGGALGAVALAFFLSPLTPVGEAKLADPSVGFTFDAFILPLGAAGAIVITLVLGLWPAIRSARMADAGAPEPVLHPSRVVGLLSRVGAPPSVLIGVRHALERGRGRASVPVGAALLGSVLAVTALCATAAFGSSLAHLTSTPALYGQPFDLSFSVNQTGATAQTDQMIAAIKDKRAITAITAGISADISIDGRVVDAIAGQSLRGRVLARTISGRLPRAPHEIALGTTTLHQLGAHLGSTVRVRAPGRGSASRTAAFRVVGLIVFSPDVSTAGLGTGALFTFDALSGAACSAHPSQDACVVTTLIHNGGAILVRASPGTRGKAVLADLARRYPSAVSYPAPPTNLVNFGEAVNFPLLFGLVLVLFGAATLLHVLVVSVVRRRREVGLLRSLGFIRRQVAFSIGWQTTTIALIGIVVGVPAGIAIGRAVWRVFAESLGVVPDPVVTAWIFLAIVGGTLVVANLLAIGPALVSARSRPARLLKAE